VAAGEALATSTFWRRLRREKAAGDFARLAGQAAREAGGPEPSEEEIVESGKRHTREELYRRPICPTIGCGLASMPTSSSPEYGCPAGLMRSCEQRYAGSFELVLRLSK